MFAPYPEHTLLPQDESLAQRVQQLLSTPVFRCYRSTDVPGVEMGGALKNVLAIACGISDGLGFGNNARAALITRGMSVCGLWIGVRRTSEGVATAKWQKVLEGIGAVARLSAHVAMQHPCFQGPSLVPSQACTRSPSWLWPRAPTPSP